jgi:hypothetical protein
MTPEHADVTREYKTLQVSFSDGSLWDIPVEVIARDWAAWYAKDYGGDVERSLREDTLPLFEEDAFEILDWATNEMNWSDVVPKTVIVEDSSQTA